MQEKRSGKNNMQHNQQEHTVSKKKNGSESRETESADIHKEREHPSVPNPAYFYEKEGQTFRAERSRTSRRSQPLRHRSTSAYGQRSARSAASPAVQKKGSSVLENTEPLNHPASHKRTTKKKRRSLKILNIAFLLVILLAGFLTFDNALLRHSNKELLTRLEAMESPPDLTVDAQTQKYGYAGKPISDLYPDMVVDWYMEPAYIPQEPMVYLTFDDGPSKMTPQILDILDAYGVKATFFVTGTKDETLSTYYKQIVDRGHTLAMHT